LSIDAHADKIARPHPHMRVKRAALGHIAQHWIAAPWESTKHLDTPLREWHEPKDGSQKGTFPGTIRTDDRDKLAGLDRKGGIPPDRASPSAHGRVLDGDHFPHR
jgi:hypothetical protein